MLKKIKNSTSWAFSGLGLFWLVLNIVSIFDDSIEPWFLGNVWACLILVIFFICIGFFRFCYLNRAIKKIKKSFPASGVELEVVEGDLFEQDGIIAITTSDFFDTTTENASNKTLKNKLVNIIFDGEYKELDKLIEGSLKEFKVEPIQHVAFDKTYGKKRQYAIGTVAKIEKNEHKVYLPVFTRLDFSNGNKRTTASIESFFTALNHFFEFTGKQDRKEFVNIPVFCSGVGSFSLSHQLLIYCIIVIYVGKAKANEACQKLRIVVSKSNYNKKNFEDLKQFISTIEI